MIIQALRGTAQLMLRRGRTASVARTVVAWEVISNNADVVWDIISSALASALGRAIYGGLSSMGRDSELQEFHRAVGLSEEEFAELEPRDRLRLAREYAENVRVPATSLQDLGD